jgi:phage tail-like protein
MTIDPGPLGLAAGASPSRRAAPTPGGFAPGLGSNGGAGGLPVARPASPRAGTASAARRASDPLSDYAVTLYYRFTVDRQDLGAFSSVSGLGVDFQVQEVEEGGGGLLVHQLVGRPKYQRLELRRPVNPDTRKVMAWLARTVHQVTPATASLVALTPDGSSICQWDLAGVVPASWTGPGFDASGAPQPAIETLVVAYQGFL